MKKVSALVEGGKASAGPPLGPQLGPLGVNIGKVIAEINNKTKDFQGMTVPVDVIVDEKTKEFEIKVGTPPTSALLKKEAGIEKGSSEPNKNFIGNLKMEQILKVARMKWDDLSGKNLKSRVMEVLGTCVSIGINVDNLSAKEVQEKIRKGYYDEILKGDENA